MWKTSLNLAVKRGLGAFRAVPPLRLSEWAEQNFYLSSESSYVAGAWKSYPYQVAILDWLGSDDIPEISFKKAARMGNTKMMMTAAAYFAIYRKRNQCVWQPTDSDAQEFTETEINSMLRDVKAFKPIFPALEKKHKDNTNSYKKFNGCVLHIKGGSSARNYRRISSDVGILDELSSFDADIGEEGSPRKLAKKRLEGATFPKLIAGSTPKTKYLCQIQAAVDEADLVFYFHVPCPHCGHMQPLRFGDRSSKYGLKWLDNDPETAAYSCADCATLFSQSDYLSIWKKGRWVAKTGEYYNEESATFHDADGNRIPAPKHLGIDGLWTIYSPQASWSGIVKEYLSAVAKARHGDQSDLKTFINTTLGEVFEENLEKTESGDLRDRAENYPLQIVPKGGLILCGGVDVQKDRFELVVWAFGRGEQMWLVDYQVIGANPAIEEEWAKLDDYLLHKYKHEAGTMLSIDHVAIDTGGHWAHQCYQYIRQRRFASGWSGSPTVAPTVYATKGSSVPGLPISGKGKLMDVTVNDKQIKNGIRLYMIGSDTSKDLIYSRLQVQDPGPGYMHLSKHLPDIFFEQLTSEARVIKQTPRGTQSVWVLKRTGTRNEVLDCTSMAIFCAHKIALHRKSEESWDAMEVIVQPNQVDLFALPDGLAKGQPVLAVTHKSGINLSGWGRH